MDVSLSELEQVINHWRARRPSSGEEHTLSPEVNRLATVYALMIYRHAKSMALADIEPPARQLVLDWRAAHPGTAA